MSISPTTGLWCVTATDAPVVGIIARCRAHGQWTCILRWSWKTGKLDEGSWTTMRLGAHRCTLSRNGEFLLYHATGPKEGPFDGIAGGAFAISRLPWLTSLTHTKTFGPGPGGGPSRDALPPRQQDRLWAMFKDWPNYVRDEHWPRHLGSGWFGLPSDDPILKSNPAILAVDKPPYLAAATRVPDTGLTLLAVVFGTEHTWSVWDGHLRFFIVNDQAPESTGEELTGVCWASRAPGGRVLVATTDAKLRVLVYPPNSALPATPKIEGEHDLSNLKPSANPPAPWAKGPLRG